MDCSAHRVLSNTDKIIHKIGVRFLQSEFSDENTEEPDIEDDTCWLPLDQYFVGISTSKLKHGILVKRITNSGVYRFLKAICSFIGRVFSILWKRWIWILLLMISESKLTG